MRDQAQQSTELATYDAARRALELAASTDDVLEIRNQAIAWAAYRRQAEDRTLEVKAMQIRFRAERRLGELVGAQKATVGLNAGSRGQLRGRDDSGGAVAEQPEDARPTLAEAGISRKLSSRAQRLAAMPLEQFEARLKRHESEALGGAPKVSADLMRVDSEEEGRAHRRNLAAELSGRTAELPSGRKYPCWYVDLPWRREGGVTGRSYENHYPTMAWPEILAFLAQARDLLLPDAWGFFWIPRAHLLALVEIEREVTLSTGEIVVFRDRVPLAWAVMMAAGFDSYSTCYVWTKTDEEHPDEAGGAILARDQDELLLLFKRGRGLPKPAGSEKFGSNHRERSRLLGHSRKPDHYRRMIATMVGCDLASEPLPVMEFFARVDAEHPLPRNWDAWGNQATSQGDVATSDSATRSVVAEALPEDPPAQAVPLACFDNCATPDDCRMSGCERRNEEIAAGALETPCREPAQPVCPPQAIGAVDALPDLFQDPDPVAPAEPPADRPGSLFADLPPLLPLSEYEALKAIGDFCYPRRAEIIAQAGAECQARGHAIQRGSGEWMLREAGQARLRELEAELPKPAPQEGLDIPDFLRRPLAKTRPTAREQGELNLARIDHAPPEIVDDKLQTRLPLTADELEMRTALEAIAEGRDVDWSISRGLVGAGFVNATTKELRVTDEGRAFLAQLVAPAEGARA